MSRHNQYKITITQLNGEQQSLEFSLEDREDLFARVEQIKQRSNLDQQDATQLGVAIRLLGPMMMKQRKHPLFVDFFPQFKNWMQHLKDAMKSSAENK